MALTFDHANLVIESTAAITDLPVFHAALRDWEDSDIGVVHPVTHKWKALSLGGGGFMYQADLINGWSLKFPNAGNYTINGNLKGSIIPVAGVYVERETSTSYVTTAQGGTGPTAADIAAAVLSTLQANTIPANMVQVKGQVINGGGTESNPWGP